MSRFFSFLVRRMGRCTALAAVAYFGIVAVHARAFAAEDTRTPGRIDFNEANLPAATVEVNLSQGMFGDLVGLGDAAIAGVAETLQQAASTGRDSEGTRVAAEQLAAARQLVQLAQGVVREVRVRVYEDFPAESVDADSLMSNFDSQLRGDNWENIVKVRDGKDTVRVSLLRKEGAVLGAFVVAADGRSLVLANVVGDVSPANVKKLTSAAAKVGLENGLQQMLDLKMQKLRHRLPTPTPAAGPDVDINELDIKLKLKRDGANRGQLPAPAQATPPTPPASPAEPAVPQPSQPEAGVESPR